MRKSKIVALVLITSALASCSKTPKEQEKRKVNMRSDSTAGYTRVNTQGHSGGGSSHMWFYSFRPYGMYDNGVYRRSGFYSGGVSESSNIGRNATKSSAIRGGFGGRSISVSS